MAARGEMDRAVVAAMVAPRKLGVFGEEAWSAVDDEVVPAAGTMNADVVVGAPRPRRVVNMAAVIYLIDQYGTNL